MTAPAAATFPTLLDRPWWQDVRRLLFLGGCFCVFSLYAALWDADESRYAEIPREMLDHKSWLIPYLDGFTYLEKPQLTYWPTMVFYQLFGVHAAVARLAPCLYFLGTLLLVYDFCRQFINREVAYATAGFLLFQPLFSFLGIHVLTDGPLTFWLTLAMVSLGRLRLMQQPRHRSAWLFWLGVAGAFFTKALVGLLFPLGILVLDVLLRRNPHPLKRILGSLFLGGVVVLALIAQWLYTMNATVPGFLYYFFITQHWDRFTGKQHGGSAYMFLVAIFAFTWPWWPLLWPALRTSWRSLRLPFLTPKPVLSIPAAASVSTAPITPPAPPAPPSDKTQSIRPAYAELRAFLFIWFAVIYLFFSASQGQLITYFLPAIPPLLMLLSLEFHLAPADKIRSCVLLGWGTGWLVVAASITFFISLAVGGTAVIELALGPAKVVIASILLVLVNVLFYLLFGFKFLPRQPGRDPLLPYMLLLLSVIFALGYVAPNLSAQLVSDSVLVRQVAQTDPHYLAVHWSEVTSESDRAAGLYFGLRRPVIHVGPAVVPVGESKRCELLDCLPHTPPELSAQMLFPTWAEFTASVPLANRPRHVLLFAPRDHLDDLPPNLDPIESQTFGRFVIYHLILLPPHAAQPPAPALPAR